MICIRCPHCKKLLDIAYELAGAVYKCPDCQKTMSVPAVKPPAPGPPAVPPVSTVATPAPGNSKAPTFAEFWSRSAAVEEERTNLECLNVKLEARKLLPLPENLSHDVGEPIASLRRVPKMQGWRVGVCLAFLLLGGVGLAVAGVLIAIGNVPDEAGRITYYRRMGVVAGVASVFPLLLSLVPLYRPASNSLGANFWICEQGLIWEKKGHADSLLFGQIVEIYQDRNFERVADGTGKVLVHAIPVIRMMLRAERVTFFATTHPETAEFVAYLEHKVTAEFFKSSLRKIYASETVSFGALDLDRHGVHFKQEVHAWSTIKAVELQEAPEPYGLVLKFRKSQLAINAHNVSMARVAASIAAVILAEKLAVDEDAIVTREETDPFAF